MEDRLLLPQRLIAQVFGVAPATVARWPVEPKEKRGRESLYWLPDVVAWRESQLARDNDVLDLEQERARQAHFTAEKTKREIELIDRTTLKAEEAERIIAEMIVSAKTKLRGMGSRLAKQVVAAAKGERTRTAAVSELITSAVDEALMELRADAFGSGRENRRRR